jgi:Mn2+/Fe2+ NRAMP family transporter
MALAAAIFAGHPEFGQFSDVGGVALGLERYAGRVPAVLFALALLDACIIGAAAVSLSTAYEVSDVLDLRHSLHRKPTEAKAFYAVYCVPIALGAALVLTPGTPLGFLTNAVQTLAGGVEFVDDYSASFQSETTALGPRNSSEQQRQRFSSYPSSWLR